VVRRILSEEYCCDEGGSTTYRVGCGNYHEHKARKEKKRPKLKNSRKTGATRETQVGFWGQQEQPTNGAPGGWKKKRGWGVCLY